MEDFRNLVRDTPDHNKRKYLLIWLYTSLILRTRCGKPSIYRSSQDLEGPQDEDMKNGEKGFKTNQLFTC